MSKATSQTESSTDTEPASAPASVRETAIDFEGLGAGEEIAVTYESTHGGEKTVRACVLATRPRTDATGYLRAVRADSRRIILANTGKLWTVSVELDGDGNQDSRVVGYEPRAERIKGKDELEGSKDGADDDAVIRPGDDYAHARPNAPAPSRWPSSATCGGSSGSRT